MRTLMLAGAVTLALSGTAVAQMCGSGMQQSSTTAQSGMMSCMGMQQAQASDPMADKPAADKGMMSGGMMCPRCKNMAMMGGMKQGGDGQPKQEMAPKQ